MKIATWHVFYKNSWAVLFSIMGLACLTLAGCASSSDDATNPDNAAAASSDDATGADAAASPDAAADSSTTAAADSSTTTAADSSTTAAADGSTAATADGAAATADGSTPPPASNGINDSDSAAPTDGTAQTADATPPPAADGAPADPAATSADGTASVDTAATTDAAPANATALAAGGDIPKDPASDGNVVVPNNPTLDAKAPVDSDSKDDDGSKTATADNGSDQKDTADTSSDDQGSESSLPALGTKMAYHIYLGDTLAKISTKIYGTPKHWKTLAHENHLANPHRIYAGDVIFYTLTAKSKAFAHKYESATTKSVTVKKGDTLSGLARRVLGSQAQWRTLWKFNGHIKNPDKLRVGDVLHYRSVAEVAHLSTIIGQWAAVGLTQLERDEMSKLH